MPQHDDECTGVKVGSQDVPPMVDTSVDEMSLTPFIEDDPNSKHGYAWDSMELATLVEDE